MRPDPDQQIEVAIRFGSAEPQAPADPRGRRRAVADAFTNGQSSDRSSGSIREEILTVTHDDRRQAMDRPMIHHPPREDAPACACSRSRSSHR